jgi:hypothetical protein
MRGEGREATVSSDNEADPNGEIGRLAEASGPLRPTLPR